MVGVTLDFSKAFDTIQHPILLKKLFAYGIRGNILKLIESYLANRQQFVTINNSNSTQKTITCGVPQGSILGPLFFLLCINHLPNVSEKLFAILFADDTSVFLEGKDLAEITNTLNAELAKLTVWLSANKLTLNTSKSHFMIIHRAKLKSSDTKIPVILSNTILEQVTFIKFLGVIIDNKLTFERHIVYTKNKISKGLGIITKARKYLNRETLLKLYNAFVFPYLTYCVEVWGTAPKKYLDPLIKIQKKIVLIITFSPYLCHTDPIFKDLNLLPISKLVTQRIGLLMFKYSIHSETYNKYHQYTGTSQRHLISIVLQYKPNSSVVILLPECTPPSYGPGCDLRCSPHCISCHHIDGCTDGCNSGYQGDGCTEGKKVGIANLLHLICVEHLFIYIHNKNT